MTPFLRTLGVLALLMISLQAGNWNAVLPSAYKIGDEWGDIASSFDVEPVKSENDFRAVAHRQYFRNVPAGKLVVQAVAIQFKSPEAARKAFLNELKNNPKARADANSPDTFESIGQSISERTVLFQQYWLRTQQGTPGDDYKTVLAAVLANAKNPRPPFPTP
jgi:hypothetical protein